MHHIAFQLICTSAPDIFDNLPSMFFFPFVTCQDGVGWLWMLQGQSLPNTYPKNISIRRQCLGNSSMKNVTSVLRACQLNDGARRAQGVAGVDQPRPEPLGTGTCAVLRRLNVHNRVSKVPLRRSGYILCYRCNHKPQLQEGQNTELRACLQSI